MIKVAYLCRKCGVALFIMWSVSINGLVETATLTNSPDTAFQWMKDKRNGSKRHSKMC